MFAAYLPFLALTFGTSLLAFVAIALLPGAASPESAQGFPFWLIAVWAPSLAALVIAHQQGDLTGFLVRASSLTGPRIWAWLITLSPLLLLAAVWMFDSGRQLTQTPELRTIALLFAFNLVLGPLGEELGWRGYLQIELQQQVGWLGAALLIGLIWTVWHMPLWLVPSPQRDIPILLFSGHVMAYAIILGALQVWAGNSVIPAIGFHLAVNLVAAIALLGGLGHPADWYRMTLLPYWGLAAIIALATTLLGPCPAEGCQISASDHAGTNTIR